MSEGCAMLSDVETRSLSPVFVGRSAEFAALTSARAPAPPGGAPARGGGGGGGGGETTRQQVLQPR
ncbi:hypothetical protein, partial [Streptomyces sp. NPDC059142]|uniref:hypothetical protein n=1 Tax=Streptomyces sp. NPDC059142 TaxID=3346739 RepID=UPI0036B4113D